LAFAPEVAGEATFPEIHAEPLLEVVETLRRHSNVAETCANLPDLDSAQAEKALLSRG
jgi:hypothetical protein